MFKCKCGSTEFTAKMVTTANVRVTTESGYPEHILGTEDNQSIDFDGVFICVKCKSGYSDIENTGNCSMPGMKRCSCGSTRFSANQACYHSIIVDGDNNFIRNIEIGEAENPYGLYHCTNCGAEYDDLDELNDLSINKGNLQNE